MARMTVGEANAVNIVLGYLSGQADPPDMVVRAMETLANRAHYRLQTGWDEMAVRRQWPAAFQSGDGDTARMPKQIRTTDEDNLTKVVEYIAAGSWGLPVAGKSGGRPGDRCGSVGARP